MLQRSGTRRWRAGIVSRAIVSVFVGLLVLTRVIPMDPRVYLGLTAVAVAHLFFIWKASVRAGVWLDWFNLVFDLSMVLAILQLGGRSESPLVILVYLWLFAMVTMNARYGEVRLLVLLATLGWGVLALGGLGGPGYGAYLGVHTMGVLLFVVTSLTLMGERRQSLLDPLTQVLHRGRGSSAWRSGCAAASPSTWPSSTSRGSSASTTPTATPEGTRCCRPWRAACSRGCGRRTW